MSGTAGRTVGRLGRSASDRASDLGRQASGGDGIAHTFVRTITPDPNRAVRDAGSSASRSALAIGGGVGTAGVGIGGGYGANRYFRMMETRDLAENQENQQQFVEDVMNDPNIDEEQQQAILDQALERGLLGEVRDQVPGEDSQFYENTYFQMVAAIIIIWFIGRRLT